jgi:hypothetical protein
VSALAAMFNPPTVRHVPSRLVISGRDVRNAKDLPPLPDALSRQEAKKLVMVMRERKYKQEWDSLNAERIKEYQKKKYQADRKDPKKVEETRKRCREYAQKNKEKLSMYSKKWYQSNRERVLAKEAEYRKKKNDSNTKQPEHQQG